MKQTFIVLTNALSVFHVIPTILVTYKIETFCTIVLLYQL